MKWPKSEGKIGVGAFWPSPELFLTRDAMVFWVLHHLMGVHQTPISAPRVQRETEKALTGRKKKT